MFFSALKSRSAIICPFRYHFACMVFHESRYTYDRPRGKATQPLYAVPLAESDTILARLPPEPSPLVFSCSPLSQGPPSLSLGGLLTGFLTSTSSITASKTMG